MNGSCETPQEELCGCCDGIGNETPQPVTNRPGLSSLGYRVGTQPVFKSSLLAGLSRSDLPALAGLRTRDNLDFSIALLDAWAVALDILTFYQERLANESYLGTAVNSRSVFELARLVGYKPSPGVSASALIAFTLNNAPGSPEQVPIPATTRVQSVPLPGQVPQVFETSSDLTAYIEHNALPAETAIPRGLNSGDTSMWLQGTANKLNVGDGLLFVSAALRQAVLGGNTSATGDIDFHLITSITLNSNSGTTFVTWDGDLAWSTANDSDVYVYVFRKKVALYGAQAIDPRIMDPAHIGQIPGYLGQSNDWNFQTLLDDYPNDVHLDAPYAGLAPVISGEPQWIVQRTRDTTAAYHITLADENAPGFFGVTAKVSRLQASNEQPIINNGSGSPFAGFIEDTRETSVFIQPDLLTPASPPYIAWSYDGTYPRQQGLLTPVEGANVEIVGGQRLAQNQPVAIVGKRLRLQVTKGSGATFVQDKGTGGFAVTDGQVFIVDGFPPSVQTQVQRIPRFRFSPLLSSSLLQPARLLSSSAAARLKLTASPASSSDANLRMGINLTPIFTTTQTWKVETTDGVTGTLHVPGGDILLLPSDKTDAVVTEGAVVSQLTVNGPITILGLDQPLGRIYDRASVTVNANVAEANHGETVHEILGSGDATNPVLQFALKQTPLTFVSSATSSGSTSTLQVWVNNLQWHEVGNFLASGPQDRVFVTRMDDSGKVTVQFGDGIRGARTPSGQMNIRAVYRKGIGAAGMVNAGQLSQPLDRPQGLSSSTNPDGASGGADPDTADAARSSAPLHVLTLGRVVSLDDYQNFADAFAGIAEALATWTWFGRSRGIFLTVAGANGAQLKSDDPTLVNLVKSLQGSGNPFLPLRVASYSPVLFEVGGLVKIDTDNYDQTLVLAAIWQALMNSFSFDQRQLGQGVAQSEVITAIQSIAGVVAVSLTVFQRQGDDPVLPLPAVLRAAAPIAGGDGTPQPAEMLLLDPASQGNLGVWS
jgi:hypothetical protein